MNNEEKTKNQGTSQPEASQQEVNGDIMEEKGKLHYYFGYDYGNNLAELDGNGNVSIDLDLLNDEQTEQKGTH